MRRVLQGLLLLAVALVAAVLLGGEALLNWGPVRDRLSAAIERATGHAVQLGPLGLAWSATPTVSVRDARLLNPPGFSRPDFATARRIEVRAALWPLLEGRVEVPEVRVSGAEVRLERDAQGRGNWLPPEVHTPAAAPEAAASRPSRAVVVGRVVVEDSRLEWWGGPPVELPYLEAGPGGGPVAGRAVFRGVDFTLAGRTGAPAATGVPVDVTLVGGGLALSATGAAGGDLAMEALAPDLAALGRLAARPLPPLKDIKATLALGPGGPGAFKAGAGGGELLPGLAVSRLEISGDGLDRPVRAVAEGRWRGLAVSASVNLANLRAPASGAAVPFQALLLADGGQLAAEGTAGAGGPVEAALTGTVPDLGRLGAQAGLRLPGARQVAFSVQVRQQSAGLAVLRGLRLTAAEGDVAGDLAVGWDGPRPSLRGTLQAGRLDLDALLAATPDPAGAAPPPQPAPQGEAAAPATPATADDAGLVPARPVPFGLLRLADADLRLAAAQVGWRGGVWRGVEARAVLRDGKLRVDPAQAAAPGGPLSAQLAADADAASANLVLRAAGLDAAGLSGGEVTGAVDVEVRLAASGADLRTLTASAAGHVGLALSEGEVDNQLLVTMFGPVLQAAKLPLDIQGRSRVRCLALRAEATGGIARVVALALDSTRLRLDGDGAVNLVDDTLDLHLRPTLRIGPTGVAIPVRLTGPVRAPRPELERGAISPGRVGISIGGASPDPCPAALAAARAP